MPRARNTTTAEIRSLVVKIKRFTEPNFVDRNDFRQAELDALRAFPDKALKAFYARKILKLPGSIAAEVLGITTALISQADATEITYSRSGRERKPNAYSKRNRNVDVSNGFFRKGANDSGRYGFEVNNFNRLAMFRNFAKLSIVANRGADVINFQPRMVASYMPESDALRFKNTELPRWRDEVALVMGGQNAPGSVGATQMEQSTAAAPPSQPESTATPVLEYTRLMQEFGYPEMFATELLNDLNGANVEILSASSTRSGRFLDINVRSSTTDVINLRNLFRANWRQLAENQGVENQGYPSVIVEDENEYLISVAPAANYGLQAESGSTSNNRRNIFTDPILASRTINWFRNNGYEDTYDRFFDLVSNTSSAMITVQDESPQSLKITVATSDGTQVSSGEMKSALAGPRFGGERGNANQLRRYRQITYSANSMRTSVTWMILPFTSEVSSSTASTEPTATTPTVAGAEFIGQEYMILSERVQSSIDADDYLKLREAGYSRRDVIALVQFIGRYGLKIVTILNRSAVGQMPPNLRISVVGRNSSARSFRNGTFLNFLRARMNSIGNTDAEVQVLAPVGRPYQSATFRGTGRGQTPVGALIIPMGNQQTQTAASASQTTSQPMTPTGGVNRQIVYLGNVQGQANMVYRGGSKRFNTNGIFAGVGEDSYSAIAFFYDPSQGSMPGSILTAPLGVIPRDAGMNFTDVMNYIADAGRFTNPGKLKAYFVRENAKNVAQGIVGLTQNTFTPVRPSGGATEITVDRVRLYTLSEFAQWASTEPMLSILRGIAGQGEGTVGGVLETQTGLMSGLTNVTESQMKAVGKLPFRTNDKGKASFGVEFEGHNLNLKRNALANKMTQAGFPMRSTDYTHREVPGEIKLTTDCTVFPQRNPPGYDYHFEMVTNLDKSQGERG